MAMKKHEYIKLYRKVHGVNPTRSQRRAVPENVLEMSECISNRFNDVFAPFDPRNDVWTTLTFESELISLFMAEFKPSEQLDSMFYRHLTPFFVNGDVIYFDVEDSNQHKFEDWLRSDDVSYLLMQRGIQEVVIRKVDGGRV